MFGIKNRKKYKPKIPNKIMEKYIGQVEDYFAHVSVAAIKLEDSLKIGDKIKISGGETQFEQIVESMQIDRKPIKSAKSGDEVGIKVNEKVRKSYKVYKISE